MNETAITALILSLIFTEITGLQPGGLIVPLYFLMYMHEGVKIAATVISALLALGVMKLLSGVAVIYGKRRFTLYIVIGLLEKMLFTWAYYGRVAGVMNLSMTIGFLVPGILAQNMEKQGSVKTLFALAAVVCTCALLNVVLTGRPV